MVPSRTRYVVLATCVHAVEVLVSICYLISFNLKLTNLSLACLECLSCGLCAEGVADLGYN